MLGGRNSPIVAGGVCIWFTATEAFGPTFRVATKSSLIIPSGRGSSTINHGGCMGSSLRTGTPFAPCQLAMATSQQQPRRRKSQLNQSSPSTSVQPGFDEGFGQGLVNDVKRKLPYLASDFTDGLNLKVLSALSFLFFACLAPAVAFGGLMGVTTAGQIGTIEMVAATAVCGMVYSLTAGQPLTIIGSTGPVLAFTAVLYKTTSRMGLPFLPVYSWVGLWTALMLGVSSMFPVAKLVAYFTRFTDEIFSLLISTIFIYEAVKDLAGLWTNPAVSLANAASSLIIASLTFGTARKLNKGRTSVLFNKPVRNLVADFAPTIGVAAGVAAAVWTKTKYAINLPCLSMPASFTTTIGRPWLVPLGAIPWSVRFMAILPALMSFVLLFMDQHITVRLVNSKQHKLKKGEGAHLDTLVIAVLTAGCSVLGLPWLVAATVRSLAHVKAVARYKVEDGKETIESMTENRVSGFAIHSMIGAAILCFRQYLAQIPLAVLMGLFMYLGLGGLKGNQLAERTKLLFTDRKLMPQVPWVTKIPLRKTHLFTILQLTCLLAMQWVKGSPFGVLFPVIIALLAPIRMLVERLGWFTPEELAVLDNDSD